MARSFFVGGFGDLGEGEGFGGVHKRKCRKEWLSRTDGNEGTLPYGGRGGPGVQRLAKKKEPHRITPHDCRRSDSC